MMINQHRDLWNEFISIHDQYQKDKSNSVRFHQIGQKLLDIIRLYERKLCSPMEKSINSTFSKNVAEKFWQEIKKDLPLIDQVGVIIKKSKKKFC